MTRELNFDPSREPLPPDEELWGAPLQTGEPDRVSNRGTSHVDARAEPTPDDAIDANDALDAQIRNLGDATYHVPSTLNVPRDAMWAAISARRVAAASGALAPLEPAAPPVIVHRLTPRTHRRLWPMFAALAATLVIGVAIGRAVDRGLEVTPGATIAGASDGDALTGSESATATADVSSALPLMLARLTTEHLSRTEALLISAKQDPNVLEADATLQGWARDLLSTTRLLLDTDQLTDPRMRQLLQDLELTLALIMQAQASGRAVDAQAVRDDLDHGDLLLRVRSASMPTMLSTDDVRGMSE